LHEVDGGLGLEGGKAGNGLQYSRVVTPGIIQ